MESIIIDLNFRQNFQKLINPIQNFWKSYFIIMFYDKSEPIMEERFNKKNGKFFTYLLLVLVRA